jgi:pyruvate/oxaloacetate carboxyltransferase
MKVYREISLREFEFWGGARDTVKYLTDDELDRIQQILEEIYIQTLTETELNDLFWFEGDVIAGWLGYRDFDELIEERDK